MQFAVGVRRWGAQFPCFAFINPSIILHTMPSKRESAVMKVFRRDIKSVMTQHRITIAELETLSGVNPVTLRKALDSTGSPRFDTAVRIAKTLRMDLNKYLAFADEELVSKI